MSSAIVGARALAAQATTRVLRERVTLDAALEGVLAEAPRVLVPPARSLSFGAVRGFFRHEAILQRVLTQPGKSLEPLVRSILSVALFELEDARTPEYAVVDAAVSTAKSAGRPPGLINALLRRYLREREALDADIARSPAARYAAPDWLAARLRKDWPDRWTDILAASDAQAPMWLRVNARHGTAQDYVATLRQAGIEAVAEPRVPQAVRLGVPCDVGEVPGFADGLVSVQDLGAQCVAFPLKLEPGQRVLDACAAPGGKTALMAEREPKLERLIALDADRKRLGRVRENLDRGRLEAEVVHGDAGAPEGWWDGVPFDRILLDAPCSALGVIRRHPDIRLRRSPEELAKMPAVQMRLLTAAFRMLAPGGRLVYATCTLTRRENGELIRGFLERETDATGVPAEDWGGWPRLGEADEGGRPHGQAVHGGGAAQGGGPDEGGRADEGGRQILPGEAGADGFYYAALTKR
jgi:16S rRNA (cytosine967-C5)-methyltransferase